MTFDYDTLHALSTQAHEIHNDLSRAACSEDFGDRPGANAAFAAVESRLRDLNAAVNRVRREREIQEFGGFYETHP